MVRDYDLIVIGGTPEAITAAEFANQLGARVALVIAQNDNYSSYLEQIYNHAWNYIYSHQQNQLSIKAIWIEMLSVIREQNYHQLAVAGVDVIFGQAEFCRLPYPGLIVNQRKLRSLAYLLAISSQVFIPFIEAINKVDYLTPEDIYQKEDLTVLPEKILVIGDNINAIQLARILNFLNKKVTLLAPKKQILPAEDLDSCFLIQAQLEAEGIQIFTNSPVSQIRQIEANKWVQAGNRAIETEEIIMATSLKKPNISGLNLGAVGVKLGKQGIKVNQKLQTTNPQIYACGDVGGGYNFPNIAEYEAKIAVKNALFYPLFEVNYNYLPYTIFTEPQLARVGLTEVQARKLYGDDIQIVKTPFQELDAASISNNSTGFAKFIVLPNGEILGVHLVGKNVAEIISIIALAGQNKLKLSTMAKLANPYLTYSEIINHIAQKWQGEHWTQNKLITNLLETFFIWRRSWFS
jgi:pyruvate/2-oxoglutarate dehydrogenase complex dihydrolipoamide dehydrogenase (E3) component